MQISSEKCYFRVHEIKHEQKIGNFAEWKIKATWLLCFLSSMGGLELMPSGDAQRVWFPEMIEELKTA